MLLFALSLLIATSVDASHEVGDVYEVGETKIKLKELAHECPQRTGPGDILLIHYTGRLAKEEGNEEDWEGHSQFDSSLERGPFRFRLGAGQVIRGWDNGLLDMCVGEKRILYIPPSEGYGEGGRPPVIPPRATLIFETELINVSEGTALQIVIDCAPWVILGFVLLAFVVYKLFYAPEPEVFELNLGEVLEGQKKREAEARRPKKKRRKGRKYA